ncbi:MAG: hypothetical protein KJ626_09180 [Verrucomicrobia bacterium]|nr:hypothetical protein [Verrucomicrobiota bacterium]
MIGVELALLILIAGAFLCLATLGRPAWARVVGPTVAVLGCAAGLIPSATVLIGAAPISLRLPWLIPLGSLSLEMDALSAVFAVPILLITALAAVYGAEYLRPYEGKKETSASWFFFNMLTASMLLVVLARNALLFLLAWEIMSLASFFLVMFEHEKESVQRAGWVYLIATHIGTAFILVLFVLLGRQSGTLDFVGFSLTQAAPALAATIFILATIGFGTKAGFIPVHVWLPEAHPAAPSHVSAVMSGVMIKTGVYGLVRVLTFLGTPPYWFGWTLVGVGAVSGILGVLFALAQHDLKRLLAYSSVENIGIIALGLGIGLLGVSCDSPIMATLGFAGALLHVINHAIFKSLLFLGAGSVLHACGTRDMNRLGGLLRRMRVTGLIILVGSAAICGLPPLNGFVSEFMIYFGALTGLATTPDGAMGGAGRRPHRRNGLTRTDRGFGRGLLHQGIRHGLPRRTAQRPYHPRARGGARHASAHGHSGSTVCRHRSLRSAPFASHSACCIGRGGHVIGCCSKYGVDRSRAVDARFNRSRSSGPGDTPRVLACPSAEGPECEHDRHVGLRLRRAIASHAVQRFLLRGSRHAHVQGIPADKLPSYAAIRTLPRVGILRKPHTRCASR